MPAFPIQFRMYIWQLECGRACLNILNIYRPPGPAPSFFSELQDMLVYLASLPHDLVLMGDFNLLLESSSSDVSSPVF